MEAEHIVALSILGSLWLGGVIGYIYSWIKTKTYPFQLSNDELFRKVFNMEKGKEDNNNGTSS